MRWRQFLTPVESVSGEDAQTLLADTAVQVVDVRQPAEYEEGHIAGAKLIPLGSLLDRTSELDTEKPVLVYCAIGGRSRVAAQLLSAHKFSKVYNMTGGYKMWDGWKSIGDYDQGLHLFEGFESLEEVLIHAYKMELALGEFYESMAETVGNPKAATLFTQLAAIENKHKRHVFAQYTAVTDTPFPKELEKDDTIEGGLTTEEYLSRLNADLENPQDILAFAMSVEGQAMDLYMRAADKAPDVATKDALNKIASEEKAHLNSLAAMMDSLYTTQA